MNEKVELCFDSVFANKWIDNVEQTSFENTELPKKLFKVDKKLEGKKSNRFIYSFLLF